MQVERPITTAITVGDQPSEADLERLKQEGYVGVVNLRQPGEPEQPLSPTEEGAKVEATGMEYLHYGVGGTPLSESGVTAVSDFVDRLAQGGGKVLVHCRRGPRRLRWCYSSRRGPTTGSPKRSSPGARPWGWRSRAVCGCWSRPISRNMADRRGARTVAASRSMHVRVQSACAVRPGPPPGRRDGHSRVGRRRL